MHIAFDFNDVFHGSLPRPHFEAHALPGIELFNVEGVKRRTARPRVKFGFYPRHTDAG